MPEEFAPTESGKDCDKYPGGWGVAMNDYEYIWYSNTNQKKYPPEACPPYYHTAAKIDLFKVNTQINGAGSIVMNGSIIMNGNVVSNSGRHVLAAKKNFDIPHPTKEGWRLRHTCPEGPSNDVYFRGRVLNRTEILLPVYWKKLVDWTTITVNLTPVGAHQNVIVKRIDEDKVYLQAHGGMPIDCFYHIYGTRADGERLIPEYEGKSPADYPGNNNEYSVSGYHYDIREEN